MDLQYFTIEEFACPLTGRMEMDEGFLRRLDQARDIADTPFVITSGFRSPEQNRRAGGREDSRHLIGEAADIAATTPEERGKIIGGLIQAGFTSMAINPARGFIHVDSWHKHWFGIY